MKVILRKDWSVQQLAQAINPTLRNGDGKYNILELQTKIFEVIGDLMMQSDYPPHLQCMSDGSLYFIPEDALEELADLHWNPDTNSWEND